PREDSVGGAGAHRRRGRIPRAAARARAGGAARRSRVDRGALASAALVSDAPEGGAHPALPRGGRGRSPVVRGAVPVRGGRDRKPRVGRRAGALFDPDREARPLPLAAGPEVAGAARRSASVRTAIGEARATLSPPPFPSPRSMVQYSASVGPCGLTGIRVRAP